MSRIFVGLALFTAACSDARVREPAPAPAGVVAPDPAPVAAPEPVTPDARPPAVVIDPDDRACTGDGDCTAILTQCSKCAGACTGVRVDRAARHDGRLDCSQYRGEVCNYDCRPSYAIEAPRCVAGRCESVRVR